MPTAPCFVHQQYRATPPCSPHDFLAPRPTGEELDGERDRWADVAGRYRAAGVKAIYLLHGGMAAGDAISLLEALARTFPAAAAVLRRLTGELAAATAPAVGTYTGTFARDFERALNHSGGERLPVRLFEWSHENNHLGRADAAVRLVAELLTAEQATGGRVMVWGHGHSGNVLALATHLLAHDRQAAREFFQAAAVYYRWPLLGWIDIPLWSRLETLLDQPSAGPDRLQLDLVTFGTPVLYGWNPGGYRRLLHFVYHRPAAGLPPYRAPFPPEADRVLRAADGDYVQQLGIAGTDVPPSLFAWRARLADHRLARVLQTGLASASTVERFQAGTRVAESGTTLLVDYGSAAGRLGDHCGGHAVYARRQWLLFHAEETARRFYPSARSNAA